MVSFWLPYQQWSPKIIFLVTITKVKVYRFDHHTNTWFTKAYRFGYHTNIWFPFGYHTSNGHQESSFWLPIHGVPRLIVLITIPIKGLPRLIVLVTLPIHC